MNHHLPINTFLGKLSILEVLDWHDSPRLLIAENAAGNRYIAFWADATEQENRWLYAAVSEHQIDRFLWGELALRTIYTDPEDGLIFLVHSSLQASSVDVTTADALEPDLLPPPNDCLETAERFGAEDDQVATPSTATLVHGITIHRPRSSKAIAFESLAAVALSWSKLVHAVTGAPPISVGARVGSLTVELQTQAGPQLPSLLNRLCTLIASPTPEHINATLSPQECRLIQQLLAALHADTLTLSVKLPFDSDALALALSHANAKALRAALIGLSQHRIGPTDVPQADDLNKLFSMLELMQANESNLGYHLELSPRHINYYKQAARILDLLDPRDILTSRGHYLVSLPHLVERYEIAMMLFESSPVGFAWLQHAGVHTAIDLEPESAMAFLNAQSTELSAATIGRRAQTLRYWVQSFRDQLA